jgi:preprotein translocase subunit SecG
MKRITNEPWFGKKTIDWGLSPITWQGWVVTVFLILIIILDISYFHKTIIEYNSSYSGYHCVFYNCYFDE